MLKVTSGIYAITNTKTGHKYIGSSRNVEKRLKTHFKALSQGNHLNPYLQNSVDKHGLENFDFSLIYKVDCDSNTLLLYEKLFMLSEGLDNLYNIVCPLTYFSLSCNYQDFLERRVETWKKTVQQNGGLPPWTEDRRKHQSQAVAGDKNGFYGKKHCEESLLKIREKARNRWSDPTERKKQSDRLKLFFEDPEARIRVGEKSKGRKQSLSANQRKSDMYSGSGNPNAQPVFYDGCEYGSLKEACEILGISKYKLKKLLKPNDYLERE